MKQNIIKLLICFILGHWQFVRAVQPSGYVIEWGWDTSTGNAAPAMQVLDNVQAVSCGRLHCLALKSNGTVVQWTPDFHGKPSFDNVPLITGEGSISSKTGLRIINTNTTTIMTNRVIKIGSEVLYNVVSIVAGDGFGLGIKHDGTVVSWGSDYVPEELTNVMAITAELGHYWALKRDGTVAGWVSDPSSQIFGQLLPVVNLSNVVTIAVGPGGNGTRGIALKNDRTVQNWGSETIYKDATPPGDLSNVVAVAAGYNHSLALKSDGTVIGWGFNNVGQATGIPTANAPYISTGPVTLGRQILSNIASIAAGRGYSMALKQDGTIVTWGRMVNDLYPVTVPAGLSNVVAIAAGDNFCLAITTNQAVANKFRQ